MKSDSKSGEKRRNTAESPQAEPRIEINGQVLREVRQHARSSMSAEICGVLIGRVEGRMTAVTASIAGEEARQGGSHVTFTQDTWTHIYRVKDSRYPDQRIVGWYHSHPGFGVFLSEHDLFIHRNFFSDPAQIAWVYDPHSDEEGCFAWEKEGGDLKRVAQIVMRDDPAGTDEIPKIETAWPVGVASQEPEPPVRKVRPFARVARWVGLVLSHLLVLLLGFIVGMLLAPRVILIPEKDEPQPAASYTAPEPAQPASPRGGDSK